MGKEKKNMRNKQAVRFLKWINEYPGWWQLICTPNHELASIRNMQTIIRKLAKESFFEIILVLIMVHRNEEFVKDLCQYMLMYLTTKEMESGQTDEIIREIIAYFE